MSTDTDHSQYGAGVVVACTCGRGDENAHGHERDCKGSTWIREQIQNASAYGVTGGVLTRAEDHLLDAVAMLIKHRCGERGGPNRDIDLGQLARATIHTAAAEICGEEADQ